MAYHNVCLESLGYTLPDEIVTSDEIELRLAPLYRRLRLPEGRLELMTGIRERRFWPRGMLPSEKSVESAERALGAAGIDRDLVGALVHTSVCRDYLEPATACGVHRRLGLSRRAAIYDVSNACLGFLNGIIQVANMIELGQIRAGLVVGTESSRQLVENTIRALNADQSLTRNDVKLALASLTIGSGSAAAVLVHRELSRTGNRLVAGLATADTEHCQLCHSAGHDEAGAEMRPLMMTDSETLLHAGVDLAHRSFAEFLDEVGWRAEEIDRTFCHQVGQAHRKLMFETLELDTAIDFSTVEWLGNTGSVAVPLTAALGVERGHAQPDDRVAFLGIGSGINCLMLGVEWQHCPVAGNAESLTPTAAEAS
jgi:3-oxoacyl-[acyl-carrier-protein] synthase III